MRIGILEIASALRYSKLERLKATYDRLGDRRLLDALQSCVSGPYAILFFPGQCLQLTPYGVEFVYASHDDVHYLTAFPQLDEKFLRTAFTGFELVLYKLCHIVLEGQRRDYHFERQKTAQRFRRLLDSIGDFDRKRLSFLFDNIFAVRDAFAHSFVPVERLQYRNVELRDCFGETYLGNTRDGGLAVGETSFVQDLRELFVPFISLFIENQLDQLDAEKFSKLCDALLMERSLSPRIG